MKIFPDGNVLTATWTPRQLAQVRIRGAAQVRLQGAKQLLDEMSLIEKLRVYADLTGKLAADPRTIILAPTVWQDFAALLLAAADALEVKAPGI